jgi:septal ring factor EnvC (AmiA/AmiB activator)
MKSNIIDGNLNGVDHESLVLKTLRSLEQKLDREIAARHDFIQWQQDELKRLQSEIVEKNNTITDINIKLIECRSNSEGNRQLINKLVTDIEKLQQNVDWYKRTYESRSLFGVIKDKLKHFFR